MIKNVKKFSAFALVGLVGLGMSALPASAAAEKNTDVFYTTHSASVDADGKVLMVVPASISLNKEKMESDLVVKMQTADATQNLPADFNAVVEIKSQNEGKLKNDNLTTEVEYSLHKDGAPITLQAAYAEFHTFKSDGNSNNSMIRTLVSVDQQDVDTLEKEKPGTIFKDKLTFNVKSFSGSGLHQN